MWTSERQLAESAEALLLHRRQRDVPDPFNSSATRGMDRAEHAVSVVQIDLHMSRRNSCVRRAACYS